MAVLAIWLVEANGQLIFPRFYLIVEKILCWIQKWVTKGTRQPKITWLWVCINPTVYNHKDPVRQSEVETINSAWLKGGGVALQFLSPVPFSTLLSNVSKRFQGREHCQFLTLLMSGWQSSLYTHMSMPHRQKHWEENKRCPNWRREGKMFYRFSDLCMHRFYLAGLLDSPSQGCPFTHLGWDLRLQQILGYY